MSVEWIHGDRTGLISTYADQTWKLATDAQRSHLFAHLALVEGAVLQTSPMLYLYESLSVSGAFYGVTDVSDHVRQ